MTYLDIQSWNRKEQFFFFKDFAQPFFNMCAEVDVTDLYAASKQRSFSYFLGMQFVMVKTANEVPAFRYRLRCDDGTSRVHGDRIWIHDVIHTGSTVLNQDDTFGFCYFEYKPDFADFHGAASEVLDAYKRGLGSMNPEDQRDNLLHCSVIPWISFTSFQHARSDNKNDSVPKIVFGKYQTRGDRMFMPLSVEVHHALMDGIHMGRFFELLQTHLNASHRLLQP